MTGIHHVTPNSGKAPAIRPFGLDRVLPAPAAEWVAR
jgi:hypothetical protein